MSAWEQAGADVRWADGPDDLTALAPIAGTVVVVDVLSFSTCVTVAVSCGAQVLPLPWRDERAQEAAAAAGALLAGPRSLSRPSLSPTSLQALPAGTTLALPSPNGAAATLAAADHAQVLVGSLRSAAATAHAAAALVGPILLVAAGERWPGGRLRPALEDRLGAGLIAAHLEGLGLVLSAEARTAALLARSADVPAAVRDSASGRELAEQGFGADVDCAVSLEADPVTALLEGGLLRAHH